MKALVYTITRANTPERARLLNSTLTIGREEAGVPFHWHLYINGAGTLANEVVDSAYRVKVVDSYQISPTNVGQHPFVNHAHNKALAEGYDYVVRVDDDVEWISKRWLAKLIEASQRVGDVMVLSPTVKGLRWQPDQSQTTTVEGIPLKFIKGPIGGICRLMPTMLLRQKPYVSDVRLPMGGGDAAGFWTWAQQQPITPLAYCQHIRVRHAKTTDGQVAEDPLHAKEHDLYQYCPHIPV